LKEPPCILLLLLLLLYYKLAESVVRIYIM